MRVKMRLLIATIFLPLPATSHGASPGGGLQGGGFGSGFGAQSAGRAFTMGSGIRRIFAFRPAFAFHKNRRFFHRDHRGFFQQFGWPVYWYPYYPYDYSYLDYGPDNDYQYWDNSAASVQPESLRPAVDHNPVVVIINTGNSRPMDSRANTAYINSGYSSNDAAGQQRIVMQDPNEKIGPGGDPRTFVPPAVPQPTQTAAKGTQTKPQAQAGIFGNLVLVSWLEEAGKDVIYVQNTETNDVQEITSEPNLDNFRIVELHPNADLRLVEAVISNGR